MGVVACCNANADNKPCTEDCPTKAPSTETLTIRLPTGLKAETTRYAKARGENLTDVVRSSLQATLTSWTVRYVYEVTSKRIGDADGPLRAPDQRYAWEVVACAGLDGWMYWTWRRRV